MNIDLPDIGLHIFSKCLTIFMKTRPGIKPITTAIISMISLVYSLNSDLLSFLNSLGFSLWIFTGVYFTIVTIWFLKEIGKVGFPSDQQKIKDRMVSLNYANFVIVGILIVYLLEVVVPVVV